MSIEGEHYKENFSEYKFNLDSFSEDELWQMAIGVLLRLHSNHPLLKAIMEKFKIKVISCPEGVEETINKLKTVGIKVSIDKENKKLS